MRMQEQDEYWSKFESSGQIAYYMQFKQAAAPCAAQSGPQVEPTRAKMQLEEENTDANHNAGAGAPRYQNG